MASIWSKGVSFDLRAGEIVGIAGVAGNGQSELLQALAGMRPIHSGTIMLHGETWTPTRPNCAKNGSPMCRRIVTTKGWFCPFEENENAILGYHGDDQFLSGPLLNIDAMRADAADKIEKFDIRPPDTRLKTANFSGGNQQKIVLAREMERDPEVLLVGQPTRGVDVGAIEFIHKRIIEMRDAGKAVLLVSVELDEIRSLSDRVIVMFDGRIAGERSPETGENELGLLMAGIDDEGDEKAA